MKLDSAQKGQLNLGLSSAELVEDKANEESDGWSEWATQWVERYAAKAKRFMVEDLIAYLKNTDGYYEPHDGRAWGGVIKRLSSAGVLELYGFAMSRTHHATPKRVWQATIGSSGSFDPEYQFPTYDHTNTLVVS